MAYQTGTATNYRDLLDKLRLFLTTDTTLVAAGQEWEQLRWVTTGTTQELILKGVGLAGTDAIYVGISSDENTASDWFNWHINGYTGYAAGQSFYTQPGTLGVSASAVYGLNLWNSTIPYWFIANGRRFAAVVNVSGRYQVMYAGLLTPYSNPIQTPYPLCIIANEGANNVAASRWSAIYSSGCRRAACLNGAVWAITQLVVPSATYYFKASEGNVFPLLPISINSGGASLVNQKYNSIYYGEADGLFVPPGIGVSTEDVIADGTYNHLVFQNNENSNLGQFWAMRLS